MATRNSWAAMAEEEDEDDHNVDELADDAFEEDGGGDMEETSGPAGRQWEQWQDGDDQEEEHGDGGDGGEGALDEQDLRRLWTAHANAVRKLERDPHTPHELLVDARAGRDAAEAKWRAAKRPHPLVKRIKWADQELKDAEAKLRQHRLDLEHHRAQAAKRTSELEERVAVDLTRVERKRAALEALHAEGAQQSPSWPSDRAALVAVSGIESDVAPILLAAIERLGSPHGGDKDAIIQELDLAAVSLNRVQGVLQDAADLAKQDGTTRHYDISGDGSSATPGGEARGTPKPPMPPTPSNPRWTRPAPHAPWRKAAGTAAAAAASTASSAPTPRLSAAEAVEQARRLVRRRVEGSTDKPSGGTAEDGEGDKRGWIVDDVSTSGSLPRGADTNDIAEAAKRDHAIAQQQFLQAQHLQQQRPSEVQLQQEEAQRAQRQLHHQEEMQRHQAAMQQAAERRAEEEARERERLIASLSPQELAQAAELQAQQSAVGALAFGTQSASEAAGLVHQANARRIAGEAAAAGVQVDVSHLVGLSPEALADWDYNNDPYA